MSRWIEPVTLEGEHVRLVPLTREHEPALTAAASDGELWKLWYTFVPSPDKTRGYIDTALDMRDRLGAHCDRRVDTCRRDRRVEDMIHMLILDRRIGCGLAVLAARDDDGDLAGEFDESFENAISRTEAAPRRAKVAVGADADLTLAVVTHSHRLEDRTGPDRLDGAAQLFLARHGLIRRGTDSDRAQEILLLNAVLRDAKCIGAGTHRLALGQELRGVARHVLEFESDDID